MKVWVAFTLIGCSLVGGCGSGERTPDDPQAAFTADAVLAPIPEPFRNVWAVEIADCSNPNGATRISIDPSTVSFPEGRFDLISLNRNGEDNLLLKVRFAGGPPQTHVLHLSNERETLSYPGPGLLRTFHRCPV